MKKTFWNFMIVLACFFWFSNAFALNIGTNITTFDGQSSNSEVSAADKMGYTGLGVGLEDQETEPGTARHERWDLEGFFLKGTVLSMVGQWDFVNGYSSYTSGDIFINADNSEGYDYVFDVDWSNQTYELLKLHGNSNLETTTYKKSSAPWRLNKNNEELVGSGAFSNTEDNSVPFYGDDVNHNIVSGFDLLPILKDLSVTDLEFAAHFTMQCGNDELEGSGTATVPEPATIMLMGAGLIGIAGYSRRKLQKRS